MKNKILIFSIFASLFLACDKSNDFIANEVDLTGLGGAPISNNQLADFNVTPPRALSTSSAATSATSYAANANLKVELTFFSPSPIKQTIFYNTIGTNPKTIVSTTPYAPAFSTLKGLDTLMIPYTVPSAPAANTVIRLDYEIENVNGLKVTRTAYIKRT